MTNKNKEVVTTAVPLSHCCACGKELDYATNIEGQSPSAGAYTICLDCGHLMMFDETLRLRNLTDQEMINIAGSPELLELQKFRGQWLIERAVADPTFEKQVEQQRAVIKAIFLGRSDA